MSDRDLLDEDGIPWLKTIFRADSDRSMHSLYDRALCECLKTVVPRNYFRDQLAVGASPEAIVKDFHSKLPLLATKGADAVPCSLIFTMVCRLRTNAFKFYYDMLSRWLVPGKRLDVQCFYATDFKLQGFGDQTYTLCDLMIWVSDEEELQQIQRNLPILETELLLGTNDRYVAQRILDIRGLTSDEKTAAIQEHISYLIERLPHAFDRDIFQEMQHLLVTCTEVFKTARSHRHLSRIISYHYLFRKEIRALAKETPSRRHLALKLMQTQLQVENPRRVLALCIGVNFFHRHELFEEAHILRAINHHIPDAYLVEGSFVGDSTRRDRVRTLYLEIEKPSADFSREEIQQLRRNLPDDLKDCVEHLMHPIFMPRNEEETMRDILALANQIKFVRDLPQVIISFDEQTHTDLVFTVVVCRVVKDDTPGIQKLLQEGSSLAYNLDRIKEVGTVRRRYPKQAAVFRVTVPKGRYLRANHSLDLQAARFYVATELVKAIGEFRDYNGGMIAKQSEALNAVKVLVGGDAKTHEFALQNLFYSIEPPVMRNVLDPSAIQRLFKMSQKAIDILSLSQDSEHLYAVIRTDDPDITAQVEKALLSQHIPSIELARTQIEAHGVNALGIIYRSENSELRERLRLVLESATCQQVLQ